ncbi:MAG: hypothetical protein R3F19_11250 [Verrucomicrobiales bacterium]
MSKVKEGLWIPLAIAIWLPAQTTSSPAQEAVPVYVDWSVDRAGTSGSGTFNGVGGMPDFLFTITGDFDSASTSVFKEDFRNIVWEHLYGSGRLQESLRFGRNPSAKIDMAVMTIDFETPVDPSSFAIALTDLEGEDAIIGASLRGVPIPNARIAKWFQGLFDSTGGVNFPSGFDATNAAIVAQVDSDGLLSDEIFDHPSSESASGWFLPNESVDSLTITFRNRAGEAASMHVFMAAAPEPVSSPPSVREVLGMVAGSVGPIVGPTVVDFGHLPGATTYEFAFTAIRDGDSTAIAGDGHWAIKLEQVAQEGVVGTQPVFGLSEAGVADDYFERRAGQSIRSVFDRRVHVVVVNEAIGETARLYIDGVEAGSVLNTKFSLSGMVSLMATGTAFDYAMGAGSVMHGWAAYNGALSRSVITALSREPFPAAGPSAAMLLGDVSRRAQGGLVFSVPGASPVDVTYSIDLVNWEVIAEGVSRSFEDTDSTRINRVEGYYRANKINP